MGIGNFLVRTLTWWNGQTLNTQLFTALHGQLVGEDAQGNRFYQNKDSSKRWVLFNGEAEASRIAPDWRCWLSHTYENAPNNEPLAHKPWEQPHKPNLTGTPLAYVPPGSIRRPDPVERKDYEAWAPE